MCLIKDKKEGTLLAQGIVEGCLYKLLSLDVSSLHSAYYNSNLSKSSSMLSICFDNKVVNSLQESNNCVLVLNNVNTSEAFPCSVSENSSRTGKIFVQLLHNRFGHPNKHALQTIIKSLPTHCLSNQSISLCDACQYSKMHQLYFSVTTIKIKAQLELLYTDLWGLAPEYSMNGYRYYISFVNDFTRYSWIFPLTLKLGALETFKHFKLLVEK